MELQQEEEAEEVVPEASIYSYRHELLSYLLPAFYLQTEVLEVTELAVVLLIMEMAVVEPGAAAE